MTEAAIIEGRRATQLRRTMLVVRVLAEAKLYPQIDVAAITDKVNEHAEPHGRVWCKRTVYRDLEVLRQTGWVDRVQTKGGRDKYSLSKMARRFFDD